MVHKFVDELKKNLKDYDKDILGHSISGFHHERVCKLLADHQGTVLIGNANADKDCNLTPTVVLNPSLESPLM